MELPKYFVIRKDVENPLWKEYIDWLNNKYNHDYRGYVHYYYGYDNNSLGNGLWAADYISSFENNPTLITLEYWNECVNGYVLPEKWRIKRNDTNSETINEYCNKLNDGVYSCSSGWVYSERVSMCNHGYSNSNGHPINHDDFTEIDFTTFKKYVLNKTNMKKIIGYKLVKTEYEKAALKLSPYLQPENRITELGGIVETLNWKSTIEEWKKAGVLDLWFEAVYEDNKIMLDNSKYEIIIANGATIIDGHVFFNDFWKSAKIVAEHSKADVVLGCGAKDVTSSHRWSVSLETINKVLNKLN